MTPDSPAKPLKEAMSDVANAFSGLIHSLKAKSPEVATNALREVEAATRRARDELEVLRQKAKTGGQRAASAARATVAGVKAQLTRVWDERPTQAKPKKRAPAKTRR